MPEMPENMKEFEGRGGGEWKHRYFGYAGNGVYACECGKIFDTGGPGPLKQESFNTPAPGVVALNDQWEAHLNQARHEQQEQGSQS